MADSSPARSRAKAIESAVLERISPTPEFLEKVASARSRLVERASEAARKLNAPLVRSLVAGSAARGTFLRDRLDLDFFLLFPPELGREELARHGLAMGRELLSKPEERYAEHPYLRGKFEGFQVDVVPGYAVSDPSGPKSAVDRTPFHQDYLTRNQDAAQVAEVRLAKQFLRSLGVYGSDARTAGLSGYLVELLILKFGSLWGFLEAAAAWSLPVHLADPGSHPRVPDDVALILNDPVDPKRNVASALSRQNLALLVLAARRYIAEPTADAFDRPPARRPTAAELAHRLRGRGSRVVGLRLGRPPVVDDILYPQLRKAERALSQEAERLGFPVLGTASSAGSDHVVILLELASGELPTVRRQDGPPVGIDRTGDFLAKWAASGRPVLQGPYLDAEGRLAVEIGRVERRPEPLLTDRLPRLPLGRDLVPLLGKDARVVALREIPPTTARLDALVALIDKRLPWSAPPSA